MQASGAPNETPLPRAVIRRSQHAEQRLKDHRERQASLAEPAVPAATSASTAEPATPPGTETPQKPATPPAQPATVDPRDSDPVYWKHRFRTIEGVLRVEREERQADRVHLNQEMTKLQDQIRTLQANKPTPAVDLTKFFTADQIEKFGEEQCMTVATVAVKSAREAAQEMIAEEIKPLRERQQAEQQRTEKSKDQAYIDELDGLIPDWRDTDKTAEWLSWLEQTDEASGLVLDDLLQKHHNAKNAKQVAKIFKRYKTETDIPAPPPPPVVPHGNATGDGGNPPPATPSGALTIPTAAEIRDFARRSSTKKRGQEGYVTAEERKLFEKRLELKFAASRPAPRQR